MLDEEIDKVLDYKVKKRIEKMFLILSPMAQLSTWNLDYSPVNQDLSSMLAEYPLGNHSEVDDVILIHKYEVEEESEED